MVDRQVFYLLSFRPAFPILGASCSWVLGVGWDRRAERCMVHLVPVPFHMAKNNR